MPLLMLLSDYKSRRSNKNKKASQSSVKKKGKLSIGLLHKPPRFIGDNTTSYDCQKKPQLSLKLFAILRSGRDSNPSIDLKANVLTS